MAFFQDNFGVASSYVSGEILHWVNQSGEQLVLHVMKRALDRGKASWGYVRSILENCQDKGISSLEEAREEEMRFRERKVSRGKARMIGNGAAAGKWCRSGFGSGRG
ncbi:DnaD domain protein [Virgibacillus oceani]